MLHQINIYNNEDCGLLQNTDNKLISYHLISSVMSLLVHNGRSPPYQLHFITLLEKMKNDELDKNLRSCRTTGALLATGFGECTNTYLKELVIFFPEQ